MSIIPIFIGFDKRERAATNVLIDSLNKYSSTPLSITLLQTNQLTKKGIYWRERDPKQSTDFSFSRFLVPNLMGYNGWAIFMDCDMLCEGDITELWNIKNHSFSIMCVKHNHVTEDSTKFLGEKQSSYPKKNWSSMMLMNCKKCKALTVDYVNTASGLDLHRFNWLSGEDQVGEIDSKWNYLVDVQDCIDEESRGLIHWTLGGPWFKEQRTMGGSLAAKWFAARDEAVKLWN